MKSLLVEQFGPIEDLRLREQPVPVPGPRQVLLQVAACGLNFYDTLIVQGKYQVKPPFPFAPGGEVAGTIAAIGAEVQGFALGDRVIGYLGHGGFTEAVAVDEERLIPLPEGIGFTEAAAMLVAHGTSHFALKIRGAVQPGDNVVILGAAGGTGLAAIQIGKALGARVIAGASTPAKLAMCQAEGADVVFNYTEGSLKEQIMALTNGKGADVVFDAVGGAWSEQALRALAWNGRLLIVGFAAGEIPKLPANLPLLKGTSIIGIMWDGFVWRERAAARRQIQELVDWFVAGRIRPHIWRVFPLEEGAKALRALADRQVIGKVVVAPRP